MIILEGNMKIFGNKIRNFRKIKGLTLQEVAEKLDVTKATVSKWELEQAVPSGSKLTQLAKLLNVELAEITDIKPLSQDEFQSFLDTIPPEKQTIFKAVNKINDKETLDELNRFLLNKLLER